MITGQTLIDWGFKPGSWFGPAIKAANQAHAHGMGEDKLKQLVAAYAPEPPNYLKLSSSGDKGFATLIDAENEHEQANIDNVRTHMLELMRLPTVVRGSIMPDACPSGQAPGTIPVGGVVATKGTIHPGMHSADICCSMAISIFEAGTNPMAVMNAGNHLTHFGPGGRPRGKQWTVSPDVLNPASENSFLSGQKMISLMREHFATQGDGNHFFYVGFMESTGQVALVTHHGSRGPGGLLYKLGMKAAQDHTAKVCPEAGKHNAWLDYDSAEGQSYWEALQILREWTHENHFAIHNAVASVAGAKITDQMWNEHNFVFMKDNLFYHAKGSTPVYKGTSIIPLNMAEPVLIVEAHREGNPSADGFAPHGAGRNYSRTQYLRENAGKTAEEMMAEQTQGLDIRFFSGRPDLSELPGAYKNADSVVAQIKKYSLATIQDRVLPYGTIMAGDFPKPWLNKNRNQAE